MNVEGPDSPVKADEATDNERGEDVWWKQWLGNFAIRLTLLVVILTALIWYLVREVNTQNHDVPTLLEKLQGLFH